MRFIQIHSVTDTTHILNVDHIKRISIQPNGAISIHMIGEEKGIYHQPREDLDTILKLLGDAGVSVQR